MRWLAVWILLLFASLASAAPAPIKAAFFGSSTTKGVGASLDSHRWSSVLCKKRGWLEENHGHSGATLTPMKKQTVKSALERPEDLASRKADIAFVFYGANDVMRKVPPPAFEKAARTLLERMKRIYGKNHVFVLTPQRTPAMTKNRAVYDLLLTKVCDELGLMLIHSENAFTDAEAKKLTTDGLHMNDAGHARFAKFVDSQLPKDLR